MQKPMCHGDDEREQEQFHIFLHDEVILAKPGQAQAAHAFYPLSLSVGAQLGVAQWPPDWLTRPNWFCPKCCHRCPLSPSLDTVDTAAAHSLLMAHLAICRIKICPEKLWYRDYNFKLGH